MDRPCHRTRPDSHCHLRRSGIQCLEAQPLRLALDNSSHLSGACFGGYRQDGDEEEGVNQIEMPVRQEFFQQIVCPDGKITTFENRNV